MSTNYAILRTAKLKAWGNIAGSGQHTFREIKTKNADPKRINENVHIGAQSSAQLMAKFRERMPEKVRKNAVLGIEYMITASPGAFNTKSEWRQYFKDAVDFLTAKHGVENVISVHAHHDETTPHLIAYVIPKDERGKLNCREFLGGRQKLSQLQTDFHAAVAHHGLERGIKGSKAKHTTIREFYSRLNAANEEKRREFQRLTEKPLSFPERIKMMFGLIPDRLEQLQRLAEAKAETELALELMSRKNSELEKTSSSIEFEFHERNEQLQRLKAELGDHQAQLKLQQRELNVEKMRIDQIKSGLAKQIEDLDKKQHSKLAELTEKLKAAERLSERFKDENDRLATELDKYRADEGLHRPR